MIRVVMILIVVWIASVSSQTYQLGLEDNIVGNYTGGFAGTDSVGRWFLLTVLEPLTLDSVNIYLDIAEGILITVYDAFTDVVVGEYLNTTVPFNASGFGYTTLDMSVIGELAVGAYKIKMNCNTYMWIEAAVIGWPFPCAIATLNTSSPVGNYYGLYNISVTKVVPTTTTTPTTTMTSTIPTTTPTSSTTFTSIPSTTTTSTVTTTTTSTTATSTTMPVPTTTKVTTTLSTTTLVPTTTPTNTPSTSTTLSTATTSTTAATTSTSTTTTIFVVVTNETKNGTQTITGTIEGTNETVVNIIILPSSNVTIEAVTVELPPMNDTNNIVSVIVTITSINDTQPATDVEITFLNVTNITEATVQDYCMAYLNDTSSNWTCVDYCLNYTANGSSITGTTPHFTSFAILLAPPRLTTVDACGHITTIEHWFTWYFWAIIGSVSGAFGLSVLFIIMVLSVPAFGMLIFGSEHMRVVKLRKAHITSRTSRSIELENV